MTRLDLREVPGLPTHLPDVLWRIRFDLEDTLFPVFHRIAWITVT